MNPMTSAELRVAISTLGLTQEGFAETFDISKRTLYRYLAGDPIPSPTAMLVRIMVKRRNWNELLTIGYGERPINLAMGASPAD